MGSAENALLALREATAGTPYEGRLFIVGGFVRDRVIGSPRSSPDIDLVLEGDALGLANFLYASGTSTISPVAYPRFGTALVHIGGHQVEIVTARRESYAPHSRKPEHVVVGTILEDARRRDFTINTLLQNLHTGEIIDPLGTGRADLESGIIRTPLDPEKTFIDDPLRMLRAVRFAGRFGFKIEDRTFAALEAISHRLSIVSKERIRDEFTKTLLGPKPSLPLETLRTTGLLSQFAPELLEMVGVTQNSYHHLPVWEHTLAVIDALPDEASLTVRLAALLHDIGKARTRTVGDRDDDVHFYAHQSVGAEIARGLLLRLRYSKDEIAVVVRLVAAHMRIGEYSDNWSTAAVRRLIRDLGPLLDDLFILHMADVAALAPEHRTLTTCQALIKRIETIGDRESIVRIQSPLTGKEIMELLSIGAGQSVGRIKTALTEAVVDGRLLPFDRKAANELARNTLKEIMPID